MVQGIANHLGICKDLSVTGSRLNPPLKPWLKEDIFNNFVVNGPHAVRLSLLQSQHTLTITRTNIGCPLAPACKNSMPVTSDDPVQICHSVSWPDSLPLSGSDEIVVIDTRGRMSRQGQGKRNFKETVIC
ncbi:hypothetical protein PoB_006399200 [Plakobranchus ocellatus]|uniref:Uncharacterized protein n=1 Tax=Plakobranchus ocellatus TaxID=259542 RepID=A0AAV4CZW6_9GAST|nr:hypothetical protein PoB_006399200 [Plakobranchus ocellatus]